MNIRFRKLQKYFINNCLRAFFAIVILSFPQGSLFSQTSQSGNIETVLNNIVAVMPGQGSNAFVIPTTAQVTTFENIFTNMNAKNYAAAQTLLTPIGYTLYKFYNTPTKDTFYLIQENTPIKLGWGTYIYNHKTTNDFAVESPHPLWDYNTWRMGIRVFTGAKAKWFSMSGTHRYANTDSSSDMAHVTNTMFHAAHRINANAIAVQVHGFDGSSSSYTGYPDAVISCGTLYPSTIYYTLRDNYVAQGFVIGVFSTSTYSSLNLLGATTNTQGKWSNSNGKKFVHIEHDQPLRFDTTKLRKCANALITTFGLPTGIADESGHPSSYTLVSAYPNPFNPSTTILVTNQSSEDYIITITDIFGRTLQTLHKGYLTSGQHSFRFDAAQLPSGVYFCNLSGKNTTKLIKLLLMK